MQQKPSSQDPPLRLCPAEVALVNGYKDMTILENEGNSQFCPIKMLLRVIRGLSHTSCLPERIQVWAIRRKGQEKVPRRLGLLYGFGSWPLVFTRVLGSLVDRLDI